MAMAAEAEHARGPGTVADRQQIFAWWPIRGRHPATVRLRELLPASVVDTAVACPRCPRQAGVVAVVDHLLADHGYASDEAAEWLELVDGDLFALAVHSLVSHDDVRRTA